MSANRFVKVSARALQACIGYMKDERDAFPELFDEPAFNACVLTMRDELRRRRKVKGA